MISVENYTHFHFLTMSKLLAESSSWPCFLTKPRLKIAKLRKVFIEIPIFYYLNSEYYIWIKLDILSYIINRVLTELTSNDFANSILWIFVRKRWYWQELDMRFIKTIFRSLLKVFKPNIIFNKIGSIRSSFLWTTKTHNISQIEKTWALNKFIQL